MNSIESLNNSTHADQTHLAQRELVSFIAAVAELFGPEQAWLSADDWLAKVSYSITRLDAAVAIGEPSQSPLRHGWQIGGLSREVVEASPRRLIRRYHQYYRPIVFSRRVWCSA